MSSPNKLLFFCLRTLVFKCVFPKLSWVVKIKTPYEMNGKQTFLRCLGVPHKEAEHPHERLISEKNAILNT